MERDQHLDSASGLAMLCQHALDRRSRPMRLQGLQPLEPSSFINDARERPLSSTELPSSISLSFRIHDLASTVVTSHEQTCLLALALVISSLSRMLLLGSADVSVIRLINSEILVESELFE